MASSDSFLNQAKASLGSKAESVLSQIARLNLRAKTLGKEELVKLFYEIYNGGTVETNQITDEIKTPIVRGGILHEIIWTKNRITRNRFPNRKLQLLLRA